MRAQGCETRWSLLGCAIPPEAPAWRKHPQLQNPVLGPHVPDSLDTGEPTEYCGVLPFNGWKVLAPLTTSEGGCCTQYRAIPVSVWVSCLQSITCAEAQLLRKMYPHVTVPWCGSMCSDSRNLLSAKGELESQGQYRVS